MLRVMDAPGFYAAFPRGGYARSKGATGTRSKLAHALYIPLSLPRIFYAWFVYSAIRPLRGIYKSAPRWRKSANDGSKASCALPHRSRGQVSVGFH